MSLEVAVHPEDAADKDGEASAVSNPVVVEHIDAAEVADAVPVVVAEAALHIVLGAAAGSTAMKVAAPNTVPMRAVDEEAEAVSFVVTALENALAAFVAHQVVQR